MTIQVGDSLPAVSLKLTPDGIKDVPITEVTKGKKVLFAVPGAFTPTCSEKHLPGFVEQAEAIKAKGVDAILCVAVNDPFVLSAWEKARNVGGKVTMLSDGNAEFTRAIGLDLDASGFGLGTRSKRYAMVVEDGVVKALMVEDAPTQAERSSAAAIWPPLGALASPPARPLIAARASWSARSLSGSPLWPRPSAIPPRGARALLEALPQVLIFDRLLVGGAPAAVFPGGAARTPGAGSRCR